MDLWTILNKKIIGDREILYCRRSFTSSHWQGIFDWMKNQYLTKNNIPVDHNLIWTWLPQSKKEYVDTLISLYPSDETYLELIRIDLSVPDKYVLLSSYAKWNVLMDYFLVFKKVPSNNEDWEDMFNIEGESNKNIQGVIPFIKKEWITKATKLPDPGLRER